MVIVYQEALDRYDEKNAELTKRAFPILKDIQKNRGATVVDVLVPFTDGKRQIGVAVNLEKAIETEGRVMTKEMEKFAALAFIDQAWKEHLRDMDDLKQSVQAAVYEQKDPLLIYKFESFELFKRFIAKVNEDTISFLTKATIPVQQSSQVDEARKQKSSQDYEESKEESKSLLSGGGSKGQRPPAERVAPAKSAKIALNTSPKKVKIGSNRY